MRKVSIMLILLTAFAAPAARGACTTIKQGILTYSAGHYLEGTPLKVGFDDYGTNYQAHLFNGSYANNYLGRDGFPPYDGDDVTYLAANPGAATKWYWPYRSTTVNMKWNDAWLSNQDCVEQDASEITTANTPDGKLDRHLGFDSYIGSGAWETNHQSDVDYTIDPAGVHWTYFVKIVAAPSTAYPSVGFWYTSDGSEIGWSIWGAFAVIQEVWNDPAYGAHGLLYKSPTSPGFGYWGNQP